MPVKLDQSGLLDNRLYIQILVISFFSLLVATCNSSGEQIKPSQTSLPQPTFTSPFPTLITRLAPTSSLARWTASPTNALQESSTPRPPASTRISDDLNPANITAVIETQIAYVTAVNETQTAYEYALLQTPSPTPTFDIPLNENGPWLVGRKDADLIVMNLDGSGLTRVTIDPHWSFPWPGSSFSSGNWLALEIGRRPEYREESLGNFPDDLAYRLLQIPPGQIEKNIPLLSPELIAEIRQVEYWMSFPTIIHALFSSPILWSPDGRYLAFVAALDGPSSDLYVYDTERDQIRRLTDGPNEAFIMSWSPDSQWILHAEAESYATHTVLIGGRPIVKAIWVASPDGNEVRKVHDVEDKMILFQAWLSPSAYIEQTIDFSYRRFNINAVDIRSGKMTPIYPCIGSFIGITSDGDIIFWSDENREQMVDNPEYACSDRLPSGYYKFKDGNSLPLPQNLSDAKLRLKWDSTLEKFLLETPEGIEMWDLSGQLITTFPKERCDPTFSPDEQWLAFWSPCDTDFNGGRRIRFYNPEGELLNEYFLKVDTFSWHPDSSGIFYKDGNQIWFLSPQDGEPVLIHPDSGMDGLIVVGE